MGNLQIIKTYRNKLENGYTQSRVFSEINEITKSDKRTEMLMNHLVG